MKLAFQLVIAAFRQHPARIVLTSCAVVAAACVVVWVVSGYDALLAQFDSFSDEYLGRYELVVVPQAVRGRMMPGGLEPEPLPAELVSMLRADPAVAAVDPIMQTRISVSRSDYHPPSEGAGRGEHHRFPLPLGEGRGEGASRRSRGGPPTFWRPMPTLVGTDAPAPPYELTAGKWIGDGEPQRMEGALSSRTAKQLGVHVGDQLTVESQAGTFPVTIAGIVEEVSLGRGGMPGFGAPRGPATSALYVPMAAAERITGRPAAVHCINIDLHDDVDGNEFRARWSARLAENEIAADLLAPGDVEDELAEGFSATGARKQAYAATGISLLAALFIIFTTLSMGADERSRQFAVLRAVALTRRQAAMVVMIESLLLAAIGWLGGLLAGWLLLEIAAHGQPGLFAHGAAIGPWAIALSGICAFGGALAAAVLPAWRVACISPLDAMISHRVGRPVRLSALAMAAGFALIALNLLLVYVMPLADEGQIALLATAGYAAMAVGFLLLVPLAVLLTERLLAPAVARALRLDRQLVATQLSSNLWRTLGTTVALTLGLALYAATQIWGYSMLAPFVPGEWVPDALVCFPHGGLPDAEIAAVRDIPGVNAARCLPLAVEQPQLAADITRSSERQTVARQDNIVLVGLDVETGLGGDDPLVDLKFVGQPREVALARMKLGRHCLIPDHFAQAAGLAVGDRFAVKPPSGKPPVEYTVAGVISLPGWHWMTKFSGLRRRSGRSAAMVFASLDDVRRDFDLDKINFFWMDRRAGASIDEIGAALVPIADRNRGKQQPVNAQGTWAFGARTFGQSVRITTPQQVRAQINARADGMIWGMSQLPLFTLAVASLGVVNSVLASIRSRRWEIGVLRAVGVTQFGLCRLILAEAIMVGLVAGVLSLAFGVTAGWCGTGISQHLSFFGGLETPLVLPWSNLAFGFAAALGLCLLAALWPAVATARQEPLALLQAGRSAM